MGGAETHCRLLYEGLVREGHEVTVLTHASGSASPIREKIGGVNILRTQSFGKLIYKPNRVAWEEAFFGPLTEIQKLTTDLQFDIVHTQNQASLILGCYLKQHFKCPIVASFHETKPEDDSYGVSRSELIFKYLPYDRIVAGSEYFRQQALRFGAPNEKISLVFQGIESPGELKNANGARCRKKLGIPRDKFLLLAIGRFKPRKRQLALLRSSLLVFKKKRNLHVCCVGSCNSGSEEYFRDTLKCAAAPELKGHVTILRDLPSEDLNLLLRTANAGVLISESEGLGLAILEYMSYGLPVIGRNIPGINEVVANDQNGILLNTCNDEELAYAIIRLIDNPTLCAFLGNNGKETVKKFLASMMVRNTIQIYHSVLAERVSGRSFGR